MKLALQDGDDSSHALTIAARSELCRIVSCGYASALVLIGGGSERAESVLLDAIESLHDDHLTANDLYAAVIQALVRVQLEALSNTGWWISKNGSSVVRCK